MLKHSKIAKLFTPFLELMLPELMRLAWRRETSSPTVHKHWTADNPGKGQDTITALLVQDLLGGNLLRADVKGYGFHYWNRLASGRERDLTRAQLPQGAKLASGTIIDRVSVLESDRAIAKSTRARYDMLTDRFDDVVKQFGSYLNSHGSAGFPTVP